MPPQRPHADAAATPRARTLPQTPTATTATTTPTVPTTDIPLPLRAITPAHAGAAPHRAASVPVAAAAEADSPEVEQAAAAVAAVAATGEDEILRS